MQKIQLTGEMVRVAQALRDQRATWDQIANKLGYDRKVVVRLLRAQGFDMSHLPPADKWTEERIKEFYKLWFQTKPFIAKRRLARMMHFDEMLLPRLQKRFGLPDRPKDLINATKHSRRKDYMAKKSTPANVLVVETAPTPAFKSDLQIAAEKLERTATTQAKFLGREIPGSTWLVVADFARAVAESEKNK